MVREAPSAEAVSFATARVAAGARELRDLIVLAWGDSLYGSVAIRKSRCKQFSAVKSSRRLLPLEATSRNCRGASYS
jgi:hypothetical protein